MKFKIGIVGGSIAGCSAAILFSRAGHDVSVYERSRGRLVGRGGGIGTISSVIESLIDKDFLDPYFPNWRTAEMPFTIKTQDQDRYGYTPWAMPMDLKVFHWSVLWNNLRKRVPDQIYHQGQLVVGCDGEDAEQAALIFEDGTTESFDLVLYADGYSSLGRKRLFSENGPQYRGYMLWRGLLPENQIENSSPLGTKLPRLAYNSLPGHMVCYFIPDDHGSVEEGSRICNWAAYVPVEESALPEFMVDRDGVLRAGTVPPGKMRLEAENRLKQLVTSNIPTYFGDIVSKTQDTYIQLIYTVDLPAYSRGRQCLIGDAGMVIQPFTGSGVFKGYNNAVDLLETIEDSDSLDDALETWSKTQVRTGKHLLALGEQMEKAFIWEPLDFASSDAESTAARWKESVTFPEEFSYQSDE